jgi:hypothetical protein
MTLEAEFATVLTTIANAGGPLGRIGDWFDAHEAAFRGEVASAELRVAVQEALAVCWSVRQHLLTDAVARVQLRRLAEPLRPSPPFGGRAGPSRPAGGPSTWIRRRDDLGP